MARHNQLGIEGEQIASEILRSKGFIILDTNWRWNHYELDIIARKNRTLAFVEVKTRTIGSEPPEQALTKAKIKRLSLAANEYIRIKGLDLEPRFDFIGIIKNDNHFESVHIEDAFEPSLFSF